jgi:hypothetical protein
MYVNGEIIIPKLGKMKYAVTEYGHVCLTTSPINVDDDKKIVLNNKGFSVIAHLYLQTNGFWNETTPDGSNHYMHIVRYELKFNVSNAMHDAIRNAIIAAWSDFIAKNEQILKEAEILHLNRKLDKKQHELSNLNDEVKIKEAEIKALHEKINKINS